MLSPVERVLVLKKIDLLQEVGPRHLIDLAKVAREVDIWKGQTIYVESDPADALYVVVEGKVQIVTRDQVSEVGPGEAFGTWALVDDAARGHRAVCLEDGVVLALDREEFYEVAAGDPALLTELLRVLARRLRKLVEERPEEARVEGEGIEEPESAEEAAASSDGSSAAGGAPPAGSAGETGPKGAEIESAVLDRPAGKPGTTGSGSGSGAE